MRRLATIDWNITVFSRDELLQQSRLWPNQGDMPLMEVAEFHEHQFKKPTCGAWVEAHRGDKQNFPTALGFWLWSLRLVANPKTVGDFIQFAEAASLEPLDDTTYFQIIGSLQAALKRPAPEFLQRRDSFVAGLTMLNDIIGVYYRYSLLAEFRHDFVAYHRQVAI